MSKTSQFRRFIRLLSPNNNSPAAVHGGTQGCNPIVSSLTLFWCIGSKTKHKLDPPKKQATSAASPARIEDIPGGVTCHNCDIFVFKITVRIYFDKFNIFF
jgi:hypothetical protein